VLKEHTNSIGMTFRLAPAGQFTMGNEKDANDLSALYPGSSNADFAAESPAHPVRLTKPFFLSVTEVTQEHYEKVMGTNPSANKTPKCPVEGVSWEDAQRFCQKLSEQESRTYRLPTEAEWEYACRAGTSTQFHFGDDAAAALAECGWYADNADKKSHPVGEKKANPWGFHDMHGNVAEWCADWFDSDTYGSTKAPDPTGPLMGSGRVFRDGSWDSRAVLCRAARRGKDMPSFKSPSLGLRVVLEPTAAD
jgi:formylglycine-generating enzyme required for sulfatase activity